MGDVRGTGYAVRCDTVRVGELEKAKKITMRVLVCDDHALFREGLRLLLEGLDPTMQVSLTPSAEKGVELARDGAFDLILMDWHLEGATAHEALTAFRDTAPFTLLVVLSGEKSPGLVRSTIDLGAAGFISKDSSPQVLMEALRTIAGGGIYLPATVLHETSARPAASAPLAGSPIDVSQAFPALTGRQADVLRATLRGLPNKLIARELGISDATVKTHLSAIFRELDVQSRTEAVYVAAKHGVRIS